MCVCVWNETCIWCFWAENLGKKQVTWIGCKILQSIGIYTNFYFLSSPLLSHLFHLINHSAYKEVEHIKISNVYFGLIYVEKVVNYSTRYMKFETFIVETLPSFCNYHGQQKENWLEVYLQYEKLLGDYHGCLNQALWILFGFTTSQNKDKFTLACKLGAL